jgi:hypothetical protein
MGKCTLCEPDNKIKELAIWTRNPENWRVVNIIDGRVYKMAPSFSEWGGSLVYSPEEKLR